MAGVAFQSTCTGIARWVLVTGDEEELRGRALRASHVCGVSTRAPRASEEGGRTPRVARARPMRLFPARKQSGAGALRSRHPSRPHWDLREDSVFRWSLSHLPPVAVTEQNERTWESHRGQADALQSPVILR